MGDEVAITYAGQELRYCIEDVLPASLQDDFDLRDEPKSLYQCDTNLVVPSRKWQSHLKPGQSYYIKVKNGETSREEKEDSSLGDVILNSLIASTAVYHISHDVDNNDKCRTYLMEQLENHGFDCLIQSKNGKNHYLIAKELNAKRIYIAFRGTKELSDWRFNLQVYRESCGSSLVQGKFHSGFLQRAQLFPLEKVLHEEMFKGMEIILCGHSLGGAVASIVAIRLQVERARYKMAGEVKCVTFGAPFFGDVELQRSVDAKKFYHFVCNNDPVPKLLAYTQSVSSFVSGLDTQISSLSHFSTGGGMSYHKRNTDSLMKTKMKYLEMFSALTPALSSMFEAATLLYPGLMWATQMKKALGIVTDMQTSTEQKKNIYVPIGNFQFLGEEANSNVFYRSSDYDVIEKYIESHFKHHTEEMKADAHALTNYEHLLKSLSRPRILFRKYPTHIDSGFSEHYVMPIDRTLNFKNPFEPVIHTVQLCKIKNRDSELLRMSFSGLNLYEVVLEKCQFYFSFPFARNPETATVKKASMGESIQRVVIEEPLRENFVMPDHGTNLIFVTQFGVCEKIIHRKDLRDINIQTITQIARYDSVSLIIRRAIQRGMGLAKIKLEMGSGSFNKIIHEIKELGDIALGYEAMKDVEKMFDEYQKDFHFIMSNEEAFEKVKGFCQRIEDYLRSPMEIKAEWNVIQKIGFGLAVTVGSAAAAYIAGPGLVVVGIAQGTGATAMGISGLFGGVAAGAAANHLMKEQMTDSVYANTLKWINQQLLEAQQKTLDERIQQQILDLQDEGGVYNDEKILTLLVDQDQKLLSDFNNCALAQCTEKSREIVRKRIKAIKMIHRIRDIFSQQCFIGLVGLQDAGKTTLLKKMWDVGGKTGFFTHTDVPLLYEVSPKVLVVDFPGSNSLDYHSKTFSICGAMNNMVVVIIPFSGDISKVISDEIQTVFSVMRGSESTKVLLCVNKCGLYLDRLKDELKSEEHPIEFLKKRFAEKLNEHYEMNQKGIFIKTDDILFTDWEIGEDDEAARFGIESVNAVRERIMDYLVSYGIYQQEEKNELLKSVSPVQG